MSPLLSFAVHATLLLYAAAMGIALVRVLRGPRAQDRVLALDFMFVVAMLAMMVLAIRADSRIVLRGEHDLGCLLRHLPGDRVDAALQQRGRVRAGRPLHGTSGDRRPQRLEPGEVLGAAFGRRAVRVEAAPGVAVAGGPDRIGRHEQRIPDCHPD